jgi:TMEM175 potassium channel family protein
VAHRETHINGLERLVGFSDGVYAFAATLLAIDIHVPVTHERLRPEQLTSLVPSVGVYALTFILIGLFWVSHHRMFETIARIDYALVWLNMFVLMTVAFLPVPNATFAEYPTSPYAVLFYAGAVIVTAIANILLWWYATHRGQGTNGNPSPVAIHGIFRRLAMTIGVMLIAIPIAFASTTVAFSFMVFYGVGSIATVIVETRRDVLS